MYIPQNKITTNLSTNGSEFQYRETSQEYIGKYWKTYEGKYYTGLGPNDYPFKEIVPIVKESDAEETNKPMQYYSAETKNSDYAHLQNADTTKEKCLPYASYPTPSVKDYATGTFNRHFVIKSNENKYIEVNTEVHDAIASKDPKWETLLYEAFTIPWVITGKKEDVQTINKNIVSFQEQRLKRRGLKEHLKGNYLKYWIN